MIPVDCLRQDHCRNGRTAATDTSIEHPRGEEYTGRSEAYVVLTACLLVSARSVVSLSNGVLRSFVVLPFKLDTLCIYGLFALVVLVALRSILNRSAVQVWVVISLPLLGYLLALMLNSDYYSYFASLGIDFIARSAPWLIVGYAVRDYKLYRNYLYASALIVLASFLANLFLLGGDVFGGDTYSQYYSYELLASTVILADAAFSRRRVLDLAFFVISTAFLLATGARGPLVCVLWYFALVSYRTAVRSPMKAIWSTCLMVAGSIPIYLRFYDLLNYLLRLVETMGLSQD